MTVKIFVSTRKTSDHI